MINTVHGLTKVTYREVLRGLQNDQMRVAYNGKSNPNMLSYDDNWDTDNSN
jgi:hypothetical protein